MREVLTLFRDIVGVFCSPSRLGSRWGSPTPLQRCNHSVLQPQPTGPSLMESYPSAEMHSVYSTAPTDWVFVGGVLPVCRDVAGVFCRPSRSGLRWGIPTRLQRCNRCFYTAPTDWAFVRGVLPSAEMHSVYSTAPADRVFVGGSLTPLQRCSQCILQPHPTGPVKSKTLTGGVLPLCRDTVSVSYSPPTNRLGHLLKWIMDMVHVGVFREQNIHPIIAVELLELN